MAEPGVSIVVPTYNEERNLPRLLRSISRQTGVAHEVVIVDQESSDATREIAAEFGCTIVRLARPAFYTPPGRNRNRGAERTTAPVLVHLDADMELPDPSFLERVLRAIDADHQALVIHEEDVAVGFWSRCKALERTFYRGTSLEAARAVTRHLFFAVGGYDEEIGSGEDIYISRRYAERTQIAASDDILIRHHTGRQSLARLLRKKFSYGRSVVPYLEKSREHGDATQRSFVKECVAAYARNASSARRTPLLYMSIYLLRALEFSAVALGIAVGRVDASRRARTAAGRRASV